MKVLLLNPPLLMSERTNLRVAPHIQEPLGLAYLAAAIRQRRKTDEVTILDCQVLNYSIGDVKRHITNHRCDVVGVTVPTLTFYNTQEVAKAIRALTPATIFVGGPHPTALPEDTLREIPETDFVIMGEGEETVVELLNSIENRNDFKKVLGIAFRHDGGITVNEHRPYIKDLDAIPMPARDLLPMDHYSPSPTFFQKTPAYSIIDARGCPCNCSFCATMFGRSIRLHSVERIIAEMELLIEKYKAKCIIFRSDTFTINQAHTSDLCTEIIRRGLQRKVTWHCQSRINTVTGELLKLMHAAGCEGIHFGVESAIPRLLEVLNKRINLDDVPKVFRWSRQAGISVCAYFMIGIPSETREETLKTITFAKNCGADFASFSIFTPYPGSPLFRQIKDEGKLRTMDWRNYSSELSFSQKVTPYVPDGRDDQDLKRMHQRAILEFYLRPSIIFRQIRGIRSMGRLKILVKGFTYLLKTSFLRAFRLL
jgi:anaerobic magnesium-protoporphyrin IX monomethyl ester cyclase